MVSFLNALVWSITILIPVLFALADSYFFLIGIVLAGVFRFIFFSKDSIQSAYEGMIEDLRARLSHDERFSHSQNEDVQVNTTVSPVVHEELPQTQSLSPEKSLSGVSVVSQEEDVPAYVPASPSARPEITIDTQIPSEPSALSVWLHDFFSDRPLAKIGGILLFLGALFFLWLIFDTVGPVGKVMISLAFGFFLLGTGVWLDKKESSVESRVLFGIGLAVNYLAILSGRHLLTVSGGIGTTPLFSDIFATIALLLNTCLAVVIALVYRSGVLLGFAFVIAYAVPFLVNSSTSSIPLLSLYTALLTLAITVISFVLSRQEKDGSLISELSLVATVGMTTLFSLASLDAKGSGYFAVGIGMLVSVFGLLFLAYKTKQTALPPLLGGYIVLMIMTFSGDVFFAMPYLLIALFLFVIYGVFRGILEGAMVGIFSIFTFLLGLFGFLMSGGNSGFVFFGLGTIIFILLGFTTTIISSLALPIIAVIGFGFSILFGMVNLEYHGLLTGEYVTMIKYLSLFLLIGASILSLKQKNGLPYLLATIMSGILLIYPNTFVQYTFLTLSTATLYTLITLVVPLLFLSRDEVSDKSLILVSFPVSALIGVYFLYLTGREYFSGIATGAAYMLQAGVYLFYALFARTKLHLDGSLVSLSDDKKNTLLVLLAIPLSLFTFSFAFLFRDIPGIMGLAWIIESSVLYMVAVRVGDGRIFSFSHLVLLIGLLKTLILMSSLFERDWVSLGLLVIMGSALMSSLWIMRNAQKNQKIPYDILHVIGIVLLAYGISIIVPSTGTGWSIFVPALILVFLVYFYSNFGGDIHTYFLTTLFVGYGFFLIDRFGEMKKEAFPLLVQLSSVVLYLASAFISLHFRSVHKGIHIFVAVIFSLLMTSLYIDHFFGTYTVSIYLTLLATIALVMGIRNENPCMRTIGLHIGLFTLLKILGYDIWQGESGMITRVVALMIAGGLMVYLSQLYARFVSRPWSEEFSFSNIFSSALSPQDTSPENVQESIISEVETNPFSADVSAELKNVDISGYSGLRFLSEDGESFIVKRHSVMRLGKQITDTMKKSEFSPGELKNAYQYIVPKLQSTMPKVDLDALLEKISLWVEKGGSLEFLSKK